MRIHILGHSDSKLEPTKNPDWPVRLRTILGRDLPGPAEITVSRLAPYGPRAGSYAARCVADAAPDVVILSVSAFACTVGLVSVRVGELFGHRARRAYEGLEHRYSGLVAPRSAGAGVPDQLLRAVARKVIGTASLASVEEVGAVYAGILHDLAQDERLQVIVMGESHFGARVQRANPGLVAKIKRLQATVRAAAADHRFPWVDIERVFRTGEDRERCFGLDGVHNSPTGHQRIADALAAALHELAPAG